MVPDIEWTPLHSAAQRDAVDVIQTYLDYKYDLNAIDASGRNVLHIAAMHGSVQFVKKLILCGFDLHQPNLSIDSRGWNSLHYASWYGHSEIVALLLKDGDVDPMTTDKDGYSPLHLATESGSISTIKLLLDAMKTQFTTSGWSELLSEVKGIARKNTAIGKFLDRWNVPIEKVLKGEAFPIHAAVNMADLTQLGGLIKTFNINERDATGETGLHLAARHGMDEIVQFLLNNGASPQIQSRSGQTPLEIAVRNNNIKRLEIFLQSFSSIRTLTKNNNVRTKPL
mgnify:CR=1 FL=1